MSDDNDADEAEEQTPSGGRDDKGIDAVDQTERRTDDEDEDRDDGDSDSDSDADADEEEWEEREHENPDDRE